MDAVLGREAFVEPLDEGAAASEVDAALHDVGIEFRRNHLQDLHDGCVYLEERFLQRVGYLRVR